MARKKKPEPPENLERWLVSYSDFMTLLFATFVVLYALAQTDVQDFVKLEDALKRAFQMGMLDSQDGILTSSDSILEGNQGATNPIMLEYLSPKYEENSYDEIKETVDKMNIKGLGASIDDRGLVIQLSDNLLTFAPGSAEISKESYEYLDSIAKLIKERFQIHIIRVEGHTDSDPVSNSIYPSNWELSSARASSVVRYFIARFGFNSKIFVAAGYADTAPLSTGNSFEDKRKNRRVEIVVLRNKFRKTTGKNIEELLKGKKNNDGISDAAKKLIGDDEKLKKNVINFKQMYNNETKRIEKIKDGPDAMKMQQRPDFLE